MTSRKSYEELEKELDRANNLIEAVRHRDIKAVGSDPLLQALLEENGGFAKPYHEEPQLEESKLELITSVLESLTYPLYVINVKDYSVEISNSAAKRLYGAKNSTCYALVFGRAKPCPEERCVLERVRKTGRACSVEHSLEEENGAKRIYEVRGHPIFDRDGELVKMIETAVDITEHKEEERERTRLLERVRHGQKFESLGVLAGGVAHDFNNILTSIIGNVELAIEDAPADSPLLESVEEIQTAAYRAHDLCKQMLSYSGGGKFFTRRVDLSEIVEGMSKLFKTVVTKEADLRFELSKTPLMVNVDISQIRQAILSVVVNSSEAIVQGGGGGVISVSTGIIECCINNVKENCTVVGISGGLYAYVKVEDTGAGMDTATQSKVYDPFFSTKSAGRGLGMSVAMGIARSHDGGMKLDSREGEGTRVSFLLPMVDESSAECGSDSRRAKIILFVDSEDQVRRLGEKMINKLGYLTVTAKSPKDALEMFREQADKMSLIFLNLQETDEEVEQLIGEFRRIKGDIRIVLISGYSEADMGERLSGARSTGFMKKPFQISELKRVIEENLSG